MASEAPLHPRRIARALDWLADEEVFEYGNDTDRATCRAALKMLQKAQRATGLTPEIADVGANVLNVLDYVKSAITRK